MVHDDDPISKIRSVSKVNLNYLRRFTGGSVRCVYSFLPLPLSKNFLRSSDRVRQILEIVLQLQGSQTRTRAEALKLFKWAPTKPPKSRSLVTQDKIIFKFTLFLQLQLKCFLFIVRS